MRVIAILCALLSGCATIKRLPAAVSQCVSEQAKAATAAALNDGARALRAADFVGEFDKFALSVGIEIAVCVLEKLARTETGSRPQHGELAAPVDPQRDLVGQRAQWMLRRYQVPK